VDEREVRGELGAVLDEPERTEEEEVGREVEREGDSGVSEESCFIRTNAELPESFDEPNRREEGGAK
jgi:hypothetical protein